MVQLVRVEWPGQHFLQRAKVKSTEIVQNLEREIGQSDADLRQRSRPMAIEIP